MTSSSQTTTDRIIGYDLARALAVFGMVIVNYKLVVAGTADQPSWLAIFAGAFEGRAVATFVVLAGIGISLLSAQARATADQAALAHARSTLLRRALFLFVGGLLYAPIWPADILHFYGIYIGVAALLLSTSSRRLAWTAGGLMVLFVVLLLTLDYERGWDFTTLTYHGFWTPAGMIRHLFFNGFHPVIPWLAFLLIGMVVGRMPMQDVGVRRRVFVTGLTVAAVAEMASWLLIRILGAGASEADREIVSAVFGTAPMPPVPLYLLAGGGVACAVIAASVEVGLRYPNAAWLRPLVHTGQLALTLYVAHVVVGMGTLEAMGRLQNQTLPFAMTATAVFCLSGIVFAHLWRRRFRRGPVESLMRRVTDRN